MGKFSFLAKTAFRDSRKDRSKLVLFMSSIILGIAALVAINSFNDNLVKDINTEAKSLLGADIEISGNRPLGEDIKPIADSIPGERATEVELFSMGYLPQQDQSQFVRIKGLEGDFPFYGKLKTIPQEAATKYKQENSALVDDGMMLQYNVAVGDSIRLGEKMFKIGGRLLSVFGGGGLGSSFAPSIYIPKNSIAETKLIQPGSLVDYAYYYKVPEEFDADAWQDRVNRKFRDNSMRIETVEEQKEDLKEAFSSLNNFLNLIALVSLLLACIGVASSVLIYVKNKIPSIAIFRCLGMKGNEAFFIYLLQIFSVGAISVLIGAALGSGIQILLPMVLQDLLPYEVDMEVSWPAILEGIGVGLAITLLFALVPLISIRKVSPLRTLRAVGDEVSATRDVWAWAIYGMIILLIFLFLWRLMGFPGDAAVFTGGLIGAFLVLFLVAKGITWTIRKFFPRKWNFVFRQGLSNLYRPNNQTNTLIVSIGLGTAILTTLFVIQGMILSNVESMGVGNQPNMILYGIERNQVEDIAAVTQKFSMPLTQQVPVVTMDLVSWKGKTKKEWLADTTRSTRRWAVNREARVSFQDTLPPDEKLLEGTFTGSVDPGDTIFISLGKRYAEGLDVGLGDEMIWNVQGAIIPTVVGSLRELNFRKMESRFFILFPLGVLEEAPQFNILVTKSPDKQTTADYRNAIVRAFPNVSVIDLGSILATLNDILTKVSYVIKFMAAFSILIGLIVLISSLFLSKFQRIKESVLLRTIGAVKKQIIQINIVEYTILGILSSATGIMIALISSFALAKWVFELDFQIKWLPIIVVFLLIVGLTVTIGLWNSREVIQKSPLEVLRREM
jgi:putative ABC transport system permease protein